MEEARYADILGASGSCDISDSNCDTPSTPSSSQVNCGCQRRETRQYNRIQLDERRLARGLLEKKTPGKAVGSIRRIVCISTETPQAPALIKLNRQPRAPRPDPVALLCVKGREQDTYHTSQDMRECGWTDVMSNLHRSTKKVLTPAAGHTRPLADPASQTHTSLSCTTDIHT